MPDTNRWEVPVLVPVLEELRNGSLLVTVARGGVVVLPPTGAFIIPPGSDELLCDVVRRARAATRPTGGGPT